MKVLYVIPSFVPAWRYGGPVVAAWGFTRELARQGHTVTVMTTNSDSYGILDVPLNRAVAMDGVEVWYFPVERPRWYCFSRPLGRALRERVGDFDIVHIHTIFLWPTTIAAYWSRKRGVPYLITPAGALDSGSLAKRYAGWKASMLSRAKKSLYLNTIGKWDLNGATGIHFILQAEMEARQAQKLHPQKYVLPWGIDVSPAEDASSLLRLREQYPQLLNKKIVLVLSRLDPIKGLDILINALGCLAAKRDDFALVVAGSGEEKYESYLTALVNQRGLQDRTVFLGLVEGDDKWEVMRQADVFALPSHHENFGLAVLEAMAAGLPVVISDKVGIHHEATNAGAGLITSLEPKEIAASIETLLDDQELRKRMGSAGVTLARQRFSWESAVENIAREYARITNRRSEGRPNAVPSAGA